MRWPKISTRAEGSSVLGQDEEERIKIRSSNEWWRFAATVERLRLQKYRKGGAQSELVFGVMGNDRHGGEIKESATKFSSGEDSNQKIQIEKDA